VRGSNTNPLSDLLRPATRVPLTAMRAAGLFDYLLQRLAQRLTRAMFDLLHPGGRMLVTNFVPLIPDIGYME